MTKTKRILSLAIFALTCTVGATAQTADRIIAQHLKSVGGADQLNKIQNAVYTGTATDSATGKSGSFAMKLSRPSSFEIEYSIDGAPTIAAFNGRSGWTKDTKDGLRTLTGAASKDIKSFALYLNDRLLNYKKEKERAILIGRPSINTRAAYQIEFTTQQGLKRNIYFDQQTYLILRAEHGIADDLRRLDYGDYKRVDGVLEPFSLEFHNGATSVRVVIDRVLHNQATVESAFRYPTESGNPLPNVVALLEDVARNQTHLESILENYTYTEDVTEHEVDKKGQTIDSSSFTREVYSYKGEKIERIIKRSGKPISNDEEASETKKIEKRIHEIDEKIRKAEERKRKAGIAEDKPEPPPSGEIKLSAGVFLRMCDFTNPRRERFRGQDVIVFDFSPKPNIKVRDLSEAFAQRMSGVMWVDESTKQIARLECRLDEKLGVLGGMITLKPGTYAIFEQTRINNEVWLPSSKDVSLSAKAMLLLNLSVNETSHFSDYKKFNVETTKSEIKDPITDKKRP